MSPEDLYRIAFLEDAQIAPAGDRIAFVETRLDREIDDYRSRIWMVAAAGGEPQGFSEGTSRDTHPRWSPDGRWLALLSKRGGDKMQIWLLPSAGGEARKLTDRGEGVSAFVWAPDSRRIAFVSRVLAQPPPDENARAATRIITTLRYKSNGDGFVYDRRPHVFVFAIDTGETFQITDGDFDDDEPCWSPDGSAIAFSSARHPGRELDTVSDIFLISPSGGEPRRLTCGLGPARAPSFSPDGLRIAYFGHDDPHTSGARNTTLWVVPGNTGEPVELTRAIDRSAIADIPPAWSQDGRSIAFAMLDRGAVSLSSATLEGGEVRQIARGRRLISSFSVSADGGQLAFIASTPTQPPELFLCSAFGSNGETGAGERQVTHRNAVWMDEVALEQPEEFTFVGPNGWEIEGWVMRPSGRPDAPAPLLLNVHGGPHMFYGWGFFDEAHVQSGAGYGVLYTNPRGSQGYGEAFARACVADWGGKDFEDIMCGLDAALERFSFVDAERIGVLGGSYGGFMTSWIVGHTNRFQAAISERAVNALTSLYGTSDIGYWFEQFEIGSDPIENQELYLRHSPLSYAGRITTPLLIVHSENDLRCPIEQAEQLYVTLKLLGKTDVVFVRFPDETHELSRSGKPSRRVERFEMILDWFDHYLRPGLQRDGHNPALARAMQRHD